MKHKKIVKTIKKARNNLEKLLVLAMRDIPHADEKDLQDIEQLKEMVTIINKWLSQ